MIRAATIYFDIYKLMNQEVESFRSAREEGSYRAPQSVVEKALVCQFYRAIHAPDEMDGSLDRDLLIHENLNHVERQTYEEMIVSLRQKAHEDDGLHIPSLLAELKAAKLLA